jgi:hypothetical protein
MRRSLNTTAKHISRLLEELEGEGL